MYEAIGKDSAKFDGVPNGISSPLFKVQEKENDNGIKDVHLLLKSPAPQAQSTQLPQSSAVVRAFRVYYMYHKSLILGHTKFLKSSNNPYFDTAMAH